MKPAIFNTDMVRAILDGRKTQSRRRGATATSELVYRCSFETPSSPYKKGDIIYVRETFKTYSDITMDKEIGVIYKADNHTALIPCEYNRTFEYATYDKWLPSIHMPKEYARLFLRVKDVRIERLNEISEEDAIAEGCYYGKGGGEVDPPAGNDLFPNLWESIYGKDSFNDDYVWVIEFEKISKEEATNE